ncbi:MAG: hypothetical protein WDM77_14985 [Steroidobacteraceae bacterium]
MVIPVTDNTDRANVIAYFQAVKDGTFKESASAGRGPGGPPPLPPGTHQPVKGSDDWKNDVPGRIHRIDLAKLPAPYDTPSSAKFPRLVAKPADANVKLPPALRCRYSPRTPPGARKMLLTPNGDILLSETQANRIVVMHPSADGSHAEKSPPTPKAWCCRTAWLSIRMPGIRSGCTWLRPIAWCAMRTRLATSPPAVSRKSWCTALTRRRGRPFLARCRLLG